MSRRIALLLLLLAAALPAGADTFLTIKSRVEGLKMPGQSPEGQITIWIAGDRLRRDDGDTSAILRTDLNKLYLVNHLDKTYNELALPLDFKKLSLAGEEALKTVVQVTPTSETKKIRDWNTKKVKVVLSNAAGLKLDTTLWVSTDIPSYQAFTRMLVSLTALQPGGVPLAQRMEQIEGIPVLQETDVTVDGGRFKTREELVSAETKDAPAGLYDPPAGYAKEPFAYPSG
jgi:hypothetical protein